MIIIIIIINFIAVPSTAALSHRNFASSGTFRDSCGVHDSLYETHFICAYDVIQLIFSYKYNLNLKGKLLLIIDFLIGIYYFLDQYIINVCPLMVT